jgi:hypothetical protein|tara:strand:+ start:3328 stop:3654 length:327 start_codon:yes stop_codon:yes gene_type:complete
MNPRQALKLVKELQDSDGWKYLETVMHTEIIQASCAISDGMNMPLEEIHYRRGAIWAARKLVELPDTLLRKLEDEVRMEALQDEDGNIVGLDASASEKQTATAVRREG